MFSHSLIVNFKAQLKQVFSLGEQVILLTWISLGIDNVFILSSKLL